MRATISSIEHSSIEIDKMVSNLNSIVDDIKQGNGTLHYLTTDTLLVNDLQSTIKNIEEGSIRFNENMEALKHNFLTRGYFRKLEKQRKKNE
jgi:phospholipid/cholesterol/gamma-HCH transport system substrate-binding protein